ncbi:MAG: M56 family metallopeptidase [Clostridium sp.]
MGIFIDLITMSLCMGVIILGFFFFRGALENKISYKTGYTICRLIVARMLIVGGVGVSIPVALLGVNSSIEGSKGVGLGSVLFIIWVTGSLIILSYYTYLYIKFMFGVNRYKHIVENQYINYLNDEMRKCSIKGSVKLYMLEGISTPLIFGILNPLIIIPRRDYSEDEIRLIFKHELVHYRRWDNLFKLMLNLVKVIHWFNPTVYVLSNMFNLYCEISCDEEVVETLSIGRKKEYAMALLNSVKSSRTNNGIFTLGFNKGAIEVKKRISRIFLSNNYSREFSRVLIGAICIASLVTLDFSYEVYEKVSVDNVKIQGSPIIKESESMVITRSFIGISREEVLEYSDDLFR